MFSATENLTDKLTAEVQASTLPPASLRVMMVLLCVALMCMMGSSVTACGVEVLTDVGTRSLGSCLWVSGLWDKYSRTSYNRCSISITLLCKEHFYPVLIILANLRKKYIVWMDLQWICTYIYIYIPQI